jgi:hypothetical protein
MYTVQAPPSPENAGEGEEKNVDDSAVTQFVKELESKERGNSSIFNMIYDEIFKYCVFLFDENFRCPAVATALSAP